MLIVFCSSAVVHTAYPLDSGSYQSIHLLRPRGMVILQNDHLVVVERSAHCIIVINNASGEVVNKFGQCGLGQVEFKCPEGVSLTHNGCIIVADTCNHRLQVLTVEGAFVAAVGSQG